ncbi:MAG: hypothetical protein QXS03_01195 [Candidatus Micrarchaeaceae archaeon]
MQGGAAKSKKIGKAYRKKKASKLKKNERKVFKKVKRRYVENKNPTQYLDRFGH